MNESEKIINALECATEDYRNHALKKGKTIQIKIYNKGKVGIASIKKEFKTIKGAMAFLEEDHVILGLNDKGKIK